MQAVLEHIPALPGVYFFKNADQTILYIGKAKSLKARVRSYFQKRQQDWKVEALLSEYSTIDYILTKSELEALLLEAQLIQEYKPKYNVLMKHGNPFLYILFTQADLPEVKLVRTKQEKGFYFGPFLHKKQARSLYDYLLRLFRLRRCSLTIKQGCLDYHLGVCAGTCLDVFSQDEYKDRIQLAKEFLKGNVEEVKRHLETQIKQYVQEKSFEKARNLYNYLSNIDVIFETIKTRFTDSKYQTEVFKAATAVNAAQEVCAQGLIELQALLGLSCRPRVIDCFDVSHTQGMYTVGSCVRFTNGLPDTSGFRRFRIKTVTKSDDYAALQEIVTRRYTSTKGFILPDIILIDGGKGQLHAALKALEPFENLKSTLCISLAKREERLFTQFDRPGAEGIQLDLQTAVGKLLIALRDYAHHFAISYHRLLRKKNFTKEESRYGNRTDY